MRNACTVKGNLSDIMIWRDILVQEFRGRQIKSSYNGKDDERLQESQKEHSSAKVTEQYMIPIMGRPKEIKEVTICVELDERNDTGVIKAGFEAINLILWQAKTKTLCRTCQHSTLDGRLFFCKAFKNPSSHRMRCEEYVPKNGDLG